MKANGKENDVMMQRAFSRTIRGAANKNKVLENESQ